MGNDNLLQSNVNKSVNMDKEVDIPPLEESFGQKPIASTRGARKKSQALPLSEIKALGFDVDFLNDLNNSGSSRPGKPILV
jgi:hypothetical protein